MSIMGITCPDGICLEVTRERSSHDRGERAGKSTTYSPLSRVGARAEGEIRFEERLLNRMPAHEIVTIGWGSRPKDAGFSPYERPGESGTGSLHRSHRVAEVKEDMETRLYAVPPIEGARGRNRQARSPVGSNRCWRWTRADGAPTPALVG